MRMPMKCFAFFLLLAGSLQAGRLGVVADWGVTPVDGFSRQEWGLRLLHNGWQYGRHGEASEYEVGLAFADGGFRMLLGASAGGGMMFATLHLGMFVEASSSRGLPLGAYARLDPLYFPRLEYRVHGDGRAYGVLGFSVPLAWTKKE